jgi:hypothetical protein
VLGSLVVDGDVRVVVESCEESKMTPPFDLRTHPEEAS